MKALCMASGYARGGVVLEKILFFLILKVMCMTVHSGAFSVGVYY